MADAYPSANAPAASLARTAALAVDAALNLPGPVTRKRKRVKAPRTAMSRTESGAAAASASEVETAADADATSVDEAEDASADASGCHEDAAVEKTAMRFARLSALSSRCASSAIHKCPQMDASSTQLHGYGRSESDSRHERSA